MSSSLKLGTIRSLERATGLNRSECEALVRAIDKRRPLVRRGYAMAAVLVFFAWMIAFGVGTDLAEGTAWDLLGALQRLGAIGFALGLLAGYGIAFALAWCTGTLVRRAMLGRALREHLHAPACFWCGYALAGLKGEGRGITCPECGKVSPIRE